MNARSFGIVVALVFLATGDATIAQSLLEGEKSPLRITKDRENQFTIVCEGPHRIMFSPDLRTWTALGVASLTDAGDYRIVDVHGAQAEKRFYVALLDGHSSQRNLIPDVSPALRDVFMIAEDRAPEQRTPTINVGVISDHDELLRIADPPPCPLPYPNTSGDTDSGGGSAGSSGGVTSSGTMGSSMPIRACSKVKVEGSPMVLVLP